LQNLSLVGRLRSRHPDPGLLPPRVVAVPTRADVFEELAQMRTPVQAEIEFQTMWPTTQAADWCGEHERRDAEL
jgi:hypothetical protein